MSQVVWKYSLPVDGRTHIFQIPGGIEDGAVLTEYDTTEDVVTVWLLIDPTNDKQLVYLTIVGTGHEFPNDWYHIGSCRVGPFVRHVVEKIDSGDED
jgi:hypothetical protein